MQKQDAIALIIYLQKANREVRVTGEEHANIQNGLRFVEAVAQGLVTVEVKPVRLPGEEAPAAPEASETSDLGGAQTVVGETTSAG